MVAVAVLEAEAVVDASGVLDAAELSATAA
jgi:hypothetical protein